MDGSYANGREEDMIDFNNTGEDIRDDDVVGDSGTDDNEEEYDVQGDHIHRSRKTSLAALYYNQSTKTRIV